MVSRRTQRSYSALSAIKAFSAENAEKISRRSQRSYPKGASRNARASRAFERIGKEMLAGMFPSASLFRAENVVIFARHSVVSTQHSASRGRVEVRTDHG